MKFLLGYKMKIVGGEIFPEWGMSNFMVNEGGDAPFPSRKNPVAPLDRQENLLF